VKFYFQTRVKVLLKRLMKL